jgi:hypothetical protein
VQHGLAAVQVLDELRDAAVVFKIGRLRLAGLRIGRALVGERDQQALVQEREFAQALGKGVVIVLSRGEDTLIGQEVDLGSALLGRTGFLQLARGIAL